MFCVIRASTLLIESSEGSEKEFFLIDYLEVTGGTALAGDVQVSGAKNAVLPMMIAALLTAEPVRFRNVPNLQDVSLLIHLLEHFGAEVSHYQDEITVSTPQLKATEANYSLVKAMRASFWVLGPLLARGGAARVALPGGDIIGARPVDMHIAALEQMGADIELKHGVVYAKAPQGLRPADIKLRFPSVGATNQILLAAALTKGETTITGAACEPEVEALADMLQAMGAQITGAGTPTVRIIGVDYLHGADVTVLGDRIEAASYMLAILLTGGNGSVRGVPPKCLGPLPDILRQTGAEVTELEDGFHVQRTQAIQAVSVKTAPSPGFATDMQAPLMAYLSLAEGVSIIEENIFEGRFGHVSELCRMGADIRIDGRKAYVTGVKSLSGAPVSAGDIRAAAALVIAGLAAEGVTKIYEPQHIRRGYSDLERKMKGLGALVGTRLSDPEDFLFVGC